MLAAAEEKRTSTTTRANAEKRPARIKEPISGKRRRPTARARDGALAKDCETSTMGYSAQRRGFFALANGCSPERAPRAIPGRGEGDGGAGDPIAQTTGEGAPGAENGGDPSGNRGYSSTEGGGGEPPKSCDDCLFILFANLEKAPPRLPSPPGDAGRSPEPEVAVPVAAPLPSPPPPSPPPQSSEQPRTGWRQMLSAFGGYFTSPFTRKRAAEEPAELPPSSKRTRVQDESEVQKTRQSPPDIVVEPQRTPRAILTPKSPRDYSGPSTKNPRMPTSLSTITEYTEPSLTLSVSESVLENTPSRPPRDMPQSSLLQVPQSTPVRRPQGTPTMRRSAQLRAARAAGTGTPSTGFTMMRAAPKPKESNADARLAKLERMRILQKELEELQKDKDVQEMQSHRVKRVKIDNLVEIPHNRPGDPSGCFRVPEEDSDDEMEVYDDVEERSNLFEEMDTETPTVRVQQSQTTPVAQTSTITVDIFDFPEVGEIRQDQRVTEEYAAEADRLFVAGVVEFQMLTA